MQYPLELFKCVSTCLTCRLAWTVSTVSYLFSVSSLPEPSVHTSGTQYLEDWLQTTQSIEVVQGGDVSTRTYRLNAAGT